MLGKQKKGNFSCITQKEQNGKLIVLESRQVSSKGVSNGII